MIRTDNLHLSIDVESCLQSYQINKVSFRLDHVLRKVCGQFIEQLENKIQNIKVQVKYLKEIYQFYVYINCKKKCIYCRGVGDVTPPNMLEIARKLIKSWSCYRRVSITLAIVLSYLLLFSENSWLNGQYAPATTENVSAHL